ncbi:MAG: serine acetyltransferase [Planctomycetaceae bacterium]|nr:serine acetyltransferase [Planctomycetaceae bacterium]MBP62477.1 serine acetyltransferase [Planctomycetaceae bacterium]
MASDFRLKEQLPNLTDRIVKSYAEIGHMNHLGHVALPSYDTVISIAEDLKDVIYPGYRRREGLHLGNITYHVGDLIDGLHDKLTTQIARVLRHAADVQTEETQEPDPPTDYEAKGQAIAIAFLDRIPEIRTLLATDVQAAFQGDPACKNIDEVIFCYPGLEAVTIYRLAHELLDLGTPFIPRMLSEWAHKETGIDIHPGATIGNYFFIDHGTGVVIGETCKIGNHVKLYQGVTLGALSFDTDADGNLLRTAKRHPTLEDHVVIYANATVLGGKTIIGHNSVIGSSVWLTQSVEPHTTVLLEKPGLRMRDDKPDELSPEANYQI